MHIEIDMVLNKLKEIIIERNQNKSEEKLSVCMLCVREL